MHQYDYDWFERGKKNRASGVLQNHGRRSRKVIGWTLITGECLHSQNWDSTKKAPGWVLELLLGKVSFYR